MKIEKLDAGRLIRTTSGQYLDVFNPDPEHINIEDIAHALSNNCRFGGHTRRFYSVAQHCIFGAKALYGYAKDHTLALQFLMHDATEGYMLDLPRPIKREMKEYSVIEDRLMEAIAAKFNIPYPFPPEVKLMDQTALEYEWENIVTADNCELLCYTPGEAKKIFLELFTRYDGLRD